MSVLGTAIASSVAQTPVQTKQIADQRDKAEAESVRNARNVRDLFQAHAETIEEDETDEDALSNPKVDQHLPDGDPTEQQSSRKRKRRPGDPGGAADAAAATALSAITDAKPIPPDSPLYRHVDVRA